MEKNTGIHDDYRRMALDDFEGVEDVYQYDATLEVFLYGENVTESMDVVEVAVPTVGRSY
jgi:hypothetical protein